MTASQHRQRGLQVVKEALAKDYAAMAYDQPYQWALYSGSQLLEARKWHVDEYSALIGGLTAADLQVCRQTHELRWGLHMLWASVQGCPSAAVDTACICRPTSSGCMSYRSHANNAQRQTRQ